MHKLSIPSELIERVTKRAGRPHPFDTIEPAKTAFLSVPMIVIIDPCSGAHGRRNGV